MFRYTKCFEIGIFTLILCCVSWSICFAVEKTTEAKKEVPFNFEEASRHVQKPKDVWPMVSAHRVDPEFTILSDRLVTSDSDPSKKLRRVEARFYSQKLAGRVWTHECTILLPENYKEQLTPERKGKVAMYGTFWAVHDLHVSKIGDPIATRMGYPVMLLNNPGRYADSKQNYLDISDLNRLRKKTGKNYYNMNCQLGVVYVQAMDVFQKFLGLDDLKAVIGGHSKAGRSATVAAAFDSRVASPVILGNEGVNRTDMIQNHLSFHHSFFQEQVKVPVFYLGVTNEGGYKMFNVNLLQERLKRKMTVEMIPNYVHDVFNEIQFMDYIMWVSHIHDGRPVAKISDITHTREGRRSVFRAKIDTKSKIQVVKAWYVYCDDARWRDLMWYHLLMKPTKDGHYEAVLKGTLPDAFMIEVGDIANGFPGYVSSVPQKLTDKPVEERLPSGWRSRLWRP